MSFPPISELLPHREGAIWLSQIVSFEVPDCVVLGALPAWISGLAPAATYGVELIAQATAVYAGLRDGNRKQGFVATVQRAEFDAPELPVGVPLRVQVQEVNVLGRAKSFVGQLWNEGERLMSCEIVVIETAEGP